MQDRSVTCMVVLLHVALDLLSKDEFDACTSKTPLNLMRSVPMKSPSSLEYLILFGWLNRLFRFLAMFDNLNLTCMLIFHVVSSGITCLRYIE